MSNTKLNAFLIACGSCAVIIIVTLTTPFGGKLQALLNNGESSNGNLTIPTTAFSGDTPSSSESTIAVADTADESAEIASTATGTKKKGTSNTNNSTNNSSSSSNSVTATPEVSLTIAKRTLPESAGTIEVNVELSSSPPKQATVAYTFSGTAQIGDDYQATNGAFVFQAGVTSASFTFSLTDDTTVESEETIIITLSSPINTTLGSTDFQTITLQDNDSAKEPACSRTDEDNSTWINAGIKQAIAEGKTEYYIPACTYRLDKTIYLPAGTKNFKLYGAGADKTVFVTPTVRFSSQIIQTGVTIMYHNDWGLWNRSNWSVDDVSEGATTLTVKDGQAAWANGTRYVVWSRQAVCHVNYPDTCNHYASEIVTVTGYDSATRTVTIDRGLGRGFIEVNDNGTQEPVKMALYDNFLSENIEVASLGFDGMLADGSGGSYGLIQASTTLGLKLHDLRAKNFSGWAVNSSLNKNVQMWNVDVSDATQTGAGAGYGITIQKSRFVEVWDSVANNNRHSFVVHSGSMDVDLHDITFNSGFDTHGYDSKRITLKNCGAGADSLNIGNGAWTLGDELSIDNCQLSLGGFFGYGLKNLNVNNVTFGARLQMLNPTETPSIGAFTFRNTTFSSDWTAIMFTGNGRYEKASFIDCTFKQPKGNTAWSILSLRPLYTTESVPGNFEFIRMKMIADDPSAHMSVGSRTADFNLTITDSIFSGPTTMRSIAIGFESYSEGTATLTNNTLYSTATNFFTNSGPTVVTSTNNQILPPQ